MKILSFAALVGTTRQPLVTFQRGKLHSVRWRASGAMEWGGDNLQVGGGDPLAAGEYAGYTHLDFDSNKGNSSELIEIFAIASVATDARVVMMLQD